jgi:hypothetical protein
MIGRDVIIVCIWIIVQYASLHLFSAGWRTVNKTERNDGNEVTCVPKPISLMSCSSQPFHSFSLNRRSFLVCCVLVINSTFEIGYRGPAEVWIEPSFVTIVNWIMTNKFGQNERHWPVRAKIRANLIKLDTFETARRILSRYTARSINRTRVTRATCLIRKFGLK